MALNEQEEADIRTMLNAYQTGKRINELDAAEGAMSEMLIAVQDGTGETRKLNLSDAVETAANPIAGRYWDETLATPVAAGHYGSLAALRELPKKLGLGRYLVTDDRVRRKLDPTNSNRFEDGSPAKLDGSMGQCIWGWNAHYYTSWKEGNNLVEVVTFMPIAGKNSIYVPEGGRSWMNVGVMDRETNTLCSVISPDERYRGGNNVVLSEYDELANDQPQKTMLGMAAVFISNRNFGIYARKRGEGWEGNWFVAQAIPEYLTRIIFGTRNIQTAFSPQLDSNGLRQGGLGPGVTGFTPGWKEYNNYYPLIPTHVGLELADGVGVVDYAITKADGTLVYTAPVPVFFGLVNPFGHLWASVRGVIVAVTAEKTLGYVAPSMNNFEDTTTDGLLPAVELPRAEGYIKRLSTNRLCGLPTEIGATSATWYADYLNADFQEAGLKVRAAGGAAYTGTGAGMNVTHIAGTATSASTIFTMPLCYFAEDPVIL